MLCISAPELPYILSTNLSPLTSSSPIPPAPRPLVITILPCFYEFSCFKFSNDISSSSALDTWLSLSRVDIQLVCSGCYNIKRLLWWLVNNCYSESLSKINTVEGKTSLPQAISVSIQPGPPLGIFIPNCNFIDGVFFLPFYSLISSNIGLGTLSIFNITSLNEHMSGCISLIGIIAARYTRGFLLCCVSRGFRDLWASWNCKHRFCVCEIFCERESL